MSRVIGVVMLNAILMNVVMLNVVAPRFELKFSIACSFGFTAWRCHWCHDYHPKG